MDSDKWRARAKGGVLRREFLGYVFKAAKWAAGIAVSVWAGEFLAARREQAKSSVVAAKGHAAGTAVVIGVAETLRLGDSVTVSASGTVSNPFAPDA